jgi:hypothetical protein
MNVFTKRGGAMDVAVWTYGVYLVVSVSLMAWVARTLFVNGRVFLVDVFRGDEAPADSVNRLLVVGFYLVNLGYVSLTLRVGYDPTTAREAIEALSGKIGFVLLVLGFMHFFNLFVLSRMRRSANRSRISAAPAAEA